MIFYETDSPGPIAEIIAAKIRLRLGTGQKVLWIVTGGSAIAVIADTSRILSGQNLENLTVTLTDERFGPVGHPDSNWQQLINAGFELPGAELIPVLTNHDRRKTTEEFAHNLSRSFAESDYSIGVFGVGPDGHTAGILPGSPEIKSRDMAVSYSDKEIVSKSPEGVKRGIDRITITATAISNLDEAIVCAFGEAKWPWLDKLEEDITLEENPAQALKQASSLVIYNDYRGERL